MNKRKLLSIALIILILISLLIITKFNKEYIPEVSTEDPIDIALDFYSDWKTGVFDSLDNFTLYQSNILSKDLKEKFKKSKGDFGSENDPVLCGIDMDSGVTIRKVYNSEDSIQLLVLSRDSLNTNQSIITLTKLNDGWYIENIRCADGEMGEEREFSFDREGYLLRESSPAPLSTDNLNLMFEEEGGDPFSFVPLIFNDESRCIEDGNEGSCDIGKYKESDSAKVKGQMTESGVEVKYFEIIKK